MIDAYLDESGIHDGASVCVVAGYFGGRGKWRKLEDDWKQMLRDFKVPMEKFHTKHFYPEPKPETWFQDGWSRRAEYKAFHTAIADTIANHKKIHPVSAGIIVPDFFKFSLEDRRFMTGATKKGGKLIGHGAPDKPYFVPFQNVVRQICSYAPVGGCAHFFVGVDQPFHRYASALFDQMMSDDLQGGPWEWKKRIGQISNPKAANTAALQISDFLSNLTYHHMLDAGERVGAVLPSPLLARCLENRMVQEDFYFSTEQMLRMTLDSVPESERFLKENFVLIRKDGSES
jgi:hypothetical protein